MTGNSLIIGKQLFDVITSGMYDNPLVVYREYIQNSVDSFDSSDISVDQTEILITIDGINRKITFKDNGHGISNQNASRMLLSLGASSKEGTKQRGFRGIGRLGGLAYCNLLQFETRSNENEKVCVIEWDRNAFDEISNEMAGKSNLEETLKKVAKVHFREPSLNDPPHFFKVEMIGVHKFHNDSILNVKLVRDFLSQVAPVPYRDDFSFTSKIHKEVLSCVDINFYNVFVNGNKITRPYSDSFNLSREQQDSIRDINKFQFFKQDGTLLASGWYATTGFLASIPSSTISRGIRIRQGNIEIGNEYSLAGYFSERRFATWHIGEIFIRDNLLKPNARRDWFENTPSFERFLEQFSYLGSHLSSLCRQSSIKRSAAAKVNSALARVENSINEGKVFIDRDHHREFLEKAKTEIENIRTLRDEKNIPLNDGQFFERLISKIETKDVIYLDKIIDGRFLRKYDKKELIQDIAKSILDHYSACKSADELISRILERYAKENAAIPASFAKLNII